MRPLNPALWMKALRVIPSVSPRQWRGLDPVARWLIASRAAVLVMTVSSGLMAGLLALRDGVLRIGAWALLVLGLALAHATNNLFNDYTDFRRGVDRDDYLRTRYGPHPLAHGLMSRRQLLGMAAATGALALACGAGLAALDGWDPFVGVLMGLGVLFVLFYTWPLKYLALGEVSVLVVWGPLMVGGGYYVLARAWSWEAAWASVPCALGATAVLLGKHIDKIDADRRKRIRTLPVVVGERAARIATLCLLAAGYLVTATLVAVRFFTPVMAVVLLAVPSLRRVVPPLLRPRPAKRPAWFPDGQGGWPLFFAPLAFVHTRGFGMWFLLGLAADTTLRLAAPGFWH